MGTKRTDTANNAPTARRSAAMQKVFEAIPREEILGALLDSGDERALRLAERLSDDKLEKTNFAIHCYAVHIAPKDVWNLLIDNRKLAVRLNLSERLDGIVQAVAAAAVPTVVLCPKCKGLKTVKTKDSEYQECPKCDGIGEILRPADKESQKMALEMGELLGVKVPLVAQQFNYMGGKGGPEVGAPDMTDWTRSTDKIFEEHNVIEAEVVKET